MKVRANREIKGSPSENRDRVNAKKYVSFLVPICHLPVHDMSSSTFRRRVPLRLFMTRIYEESG